MLTLEEIHVSIQNLRKTGIWQYTSVFLNEMRVHKNTFFENRLKRENVLLEFDPNWASYAWKCKDPKVEKIRKNCNAWGDSIRPLHKLFRNLERSKQHESRAKIYAKVLRKLTLDVLEDSYQQVIAGQDHLETSPLILRKKDQMISSLQRKLHSTENCLTTGALLSEIHRIQKGINPKFSPIHAGPSPE